MTGAVMFPGVEGDPAIAVIELLTHANAVMETCVAAVGVRLIEQAELVRTCALSRSDDRAHDAAGVRVLLVGHSSWITTNGRVGNCGLTTGKGWNIPQAEIV